MGVEFNQEWVGATATRNYMSSNPLMDLLNLYGKDHGLKRDDELPGYHPRTDFTSFILSQGVAKVGYPVIAQVGPDKRDRAHKFGVKSWKDPRLTPGLMGIRGANTAPTLRSIIEVNRDANSLALSPAKIRATEEEWRRIPPLEFRDSAPAAVPLVPITV